MGFSRRINLCGGFPQLGFPFWGPYNKDGSILGSIWGSRCFGKHMGVVPTKTSAVLGLSSGAFNAKSRTMYRDDYKAFQRVCYDLGTAPTQ